LGTDTGAAEMTFTLGFAAGVAVTLAWVFWAARRDDDSDTYADYCNEQDARKDVGE
jgi:hypothetical protein